MEDKSLQEQDVQSAASAIRDRFGAEISEFRGETRLFLAPEKLSEAAQLLKDEFNFDFLSSLTASDYWPQLEPRFHVIYQLFSNAHHAACACGFLWMTKIRLCLP